RAHGRMSRSWPPLPSPPRNGGGCPPVEAADEMTFACLEKQDVQQVQNGTLPLAGRAGEGGAVGTSCHSDLTFPQASGSKTSALAINRLPHDPTTEDRPLYRYRLPLVPRRVDPAGPGAGEAAGRYRGEG